MLNNYLINLNVYMTDAFNKGTDRFFVLQWCSGVKVKTMLGGKYHTERLFCTGDK